MFLGTTSSVILQVCSINKIIADGRTHQEGAVHPGGRFVAGEKPDDLEGKGVSCSSLSTGGTLLSGGFHRALRRVWEVIPVLITPSGYYQLLPQSQKPCPRAVFLAEGR